MGNLFLFATFDGNTSAICPGREEVIEQTGGMNICLLFLFSNWLTSLKARGYTKVMHQVTQKKKKGCEYMFLIIQKHFKALKCHIFKMIVSILYCVYNLRVVYTS